VRARRAEGFYSWQSGEEARYLIRWDASTFDSDEVSLLYENCRPPLTKVSRRPRAHAGSRGSGRRIFVILAASRAKAFRLRQTLTRMIALEWRLRSLIPLRIALTGVPKSPTAKAMKAVFYPNRPHSGCVLQLLPVLPLSLTCIRRP
jgi:hypothetical protein